MKNALLTLASLSIAPTAMAEAYVGVTLAYTDAEDLSFQDTGTNSFDIDSTITPRVSLGWEIDSAPDYRAELELSYLMIEAEGSGGTVTGEEASGVAGMVNVYVDFPLNDHLPQWEIYVGIGAGFAHIDADFGIDGVGSYHDTDTVAAFQAMAGVSWELTTDITAFAGIRYFTTSELGDNGGELDRYSAASIEAGARFSF